MKKIIISIITLTLSLLIIDPLNTAAYSYGDPGEEKFAEAYKEVKQYVEADDWDQAEQVIETYDKEFNLYFKQTVPYIEEALENQDQELLLKSYRTALRLNVERRLHFAQEQFEDYGQAKLLLAKARGTFDVLQPSFKDDQGEEAAQSIYDSFDQALQSLGNPGLFGIGDQQSDQETFEREIEAINTSLKEAFPVPDQEDNNANLTEENLGLFGGEDGESNPIWKWVSIGLVVLFILLIVFNRMKNRKKE
ncbi:hypothetical protein IMZ31_13850 [Pontibacillus sp. ALD_SL1]|uniref:hypothetical protein n=1 Tax=Pontibacillus sp. ALD_SL1 TaxID=2777185 RepID=UPI001A9629C7|nr:hypothetical protein [Pontibacillus sp. ALD_SL1]QSS99158.1 hypothetical protein IMZ31_13850 [Pontibacillus sp. ALD_SL1]